MNTIKSWLYHYEVCMFDMACSSRRVSLLVCACVYPVCFRDRTWR